MVGMMGGGGGTDSLSMESMVEYLRDPERMIRTFDTWKKERASHEEHLRKARAGIGEAEARAADILDRAGQEASRVKAEAQAEARNALTDAGDKARELQERASADRDAAATALAAASTAEREARAKLAEAESQAADAVKARQAAEAETALARKLVSDMKAVLAGA